MQSFDAIFIGAGQASPSLAARMAERGRTVALVERKFLGGTCVNAGCMPTKTLVASARAAHVSRRAGAFGVTITGEISVDMQAVRQRAHQITMDARNGLADWLGTTDGIVIIYGHARFAAPDRIAVNGDTLTDFSNTDKLDLSELRLNASQQAQVNWISADNRLSYIDTTQSINSWSLTINGVFNSSQIIFA